MKVNFKEKSLMSEEALSQQEVEYAVSEAKLQLESDILATEKCLVSKKADLADAKCTAPLDTKKIIDLQIEVEAYEDGLKRLKNLKNEYGF